MSPRQARNPVAVFFGWLLMGIGGLIVVTAGACSAIFAIPAILSSLEYPPGLPGLLLMVLLFGGIPIVVGFCLFFVGRTLAPPVRIRQLPPRPVEDAGDQP